MVIDGSGRPSGGAAGAIAALSGMVAAAGSRGRSGVGDDTGSPGLATPDGMSTRKYGMPEGTCATPPGTGALRLDAEPSGNWETCAKGLSCR